MQDKYIGPPFLCISKYFFSQLDRFFTDYVLHIDIKEK